MYIITTTTYLKDDTKSVATSNTYSCEKEANSRFNIEVAYKKVGAIVELYELIKIKQVA